MQFPEVPGCFSAAHTFEEIVPNAIEASSLFFEDTEPAPPRGLESVREQVADDIAKGAVLMMIPYVRDRKRVVRVNLSPEKGFLDTLDEARPHARHDPLRIRREGRDAGNSRSGLNVIVLGRAGAAATATRTRGRRSSSTARAGPAVRDAADLREALASGGSGLR